MKFILSLVSLSFVLNTTSAQDKYSSQDQAAMVASERAFANATSFLGIREGFLTFFSDESISFDAKLGSAKDYLLKNPNSKYPVKSKLLWMPEFGDISASGDLGFLTGPWEYCFDPALKRNSLYGIYFSVWTKDNNGLWKVFFDGGINTSERKFELNKLNFTSISDSIELKARQSINPKTSKTEILNAEKDYFAKSGTSNISAEDEYLLDNSILLTEGMFAITGKKEIIKLLNTSGVQKISGDTKGIQVANSGDMAFTYGFFKNITNNEKPVAGYFARVWKQKSTGDWKILIEIKKKE